MFSGTLLLLTNSLCVYLRPFCGGSLRDTLFTTGKRRADPRTFDRTYNPQNAGISLILLPQTEEARRPVKNQPDLARFSRINKIPSNQQDYPESARFLRIGQTLSRTRGLRIQQTFAHGFSVIESHLPTAIHSRELSRVASSVIKRHIGLSRVCGESLVGPGPLLIDCS